MVGIQANTTSLNHRRLNTPLTGSALDNKRHDLPPQRLDAADKHGDSGEFKLLSLPVSQNVQDIFEQALLNNKLNLIRGQENSLLPRYGEARGAIFPDGSKGALLKLDQTEIFYLSDTNGNKTYYQITPEGRVGEPLNIGTTSLAATDPGKPALTAQIDASGNLKVEGLTPREGEAKQDAIFNGESGRLEVRFYPEVDSDPSEISMYPINVWHDAELPDVKESNNNKLNTLREQDTTRVNDYVGYQNAEFLDGSRASLISFGENEVFLLEDSTGTKSYYRVNSDGSVGAPLEEGRMSFYGSETEPTLNVQVDPSGRLILHVGTRPEGHDLHWASLDPQTNELTATSYPEGYSNPDQSISINAGIWEGAQLQNENTPGNDTFATAELYNYYSNTPEGQAILNAEGAYLTPSEEVDQGLFNARVQYNRGQGGMELFADFMPDRTALLNDPDALAAYDVQFERALAHVQGNSRVSETGEPLDPSLQFIVAASITEAVGHSPELMGAVLDDIDRGWHVEYEADYGGLYSQHRPLFQSQKARIHLRLNDFLTSFVRPDRLYRVMPHELAHSLDSYRVNGLDGIPTGMSADDAAILVAERDKLFAANAAGTETGLRDYAYLNVKEFWGEVAANYLSGDVTARAVWEASPALFDVLQRYLGLDYKFS